MKKHIKFLVLLLSLALLIGCIAIVASADSGNVAKIGDTEYATLNAAIQAVEEGGTITLIKDVSQGSYSIGKSHTLDLNGHTITSTYDHLFHVNGNVEFNVIGSGDIKNVERLIVTNSETFAPTITFTGSGEGISVYQNPRKTDSIVQMLHGKAYFKNMNFYAKDMAGESAVFRGSNNGTSYMEFYKCKILLDGPIDNSSDAIFAPHGAASVKFMNSHLETHGAIVLCKDGTADCNLHILNSVVKVTPHPNMTSDQRKVCALSGWGTSVTNPIVVEDSYVEFYYRLQGSGGAKAKFINSTLRHIGLTETDSSNDRILSRFGYVEFDGTSVYIMNAVAGDITFSSDGNGGKVIIAEGFRTNSENLIKKSSYKGFVCPDKNTYDKTNEFMV